MIPRRTLGSVLIVIGFCLLGLGARASDLDPAAAALLQKVKSAYATAATFSCTGHYENDLQTTMPVKLMGNLKILFSRPDEMRVDWTDTLMGGEVLTSSVFTQDKTYFFLFGQLHKWSPQKDLASALGEATGVSHSVCATIPDLLLGKTETLSFKVLKPITSGSVDGHACQILSGTTKYMGDIEMEVDPVTFVIYQTKNALVIRSKDVQKRVEEARKKLATTNPEIAANIHDLPVMPDFTSVNVISYHQPTFGPQLQPADFIYPVPADVKKVDNVLR